MIMSCRLRDDYKRFELSHVQGSLVKGWDDPIIGTR